MKNLGHMEVTSLWDDTYLFDWGIFLKRTHIFAAVKNENLGVVWNQKSPAHTLKQFQKAHK